MRCRAWVPVRCRARVPVRCRARVLASAPSTTISIYDRPREASGLVRVRVPSMTCSGACRSARCRCRWRLRQVGSRVLVRRRCCCDVLPVLTLWRAQLLPQGGRCWWTISSKTRFPRPCPTLLQRRSSRPRRCSAASRARRRRERAHKSAWPRADKLALQPCASLPCVDRARGRPWLQDCRLSSL